MRSNLAMVDAFLRRSVLEVSNYSGNDLGFLGIKPGEEQRNIHNGSVMTIQVALLYQILKNYQVLKRVKSTLEYPSLEDFLKDLESGGEFVNGMRLIRNGVFHVNTSNPRDKQAITSFNETCKQRGGVPAVMAELKKLFYDFTEKIFLGELQIWPDRIYADLERMEKERPGFKERLEKGELNFPEDFALTNMDELEN